MSLVSSRVNLTHRVTVERDQATGAGWGDKAVPDWQPHLTGLQCRFWADAGRKQIDAQTEVVVEDLRLIVQPGTDVTERDRLGDITLRGGVVLAGPTLIQAVLPHTDHLELVLERLT